MRTTGLCAVAGLAFFSLTSVSASEQMRPGNALEEGKLAVSVYGVAAEEEDLVFRLRGADLVQVPLAGGGTAQFFASGETDLRFKCEMQAKVVRIVWRPANGLHYAFKGGLADFELSVPSGSVVNKLENASPGCVWGVEAAWTMVSDTPVTPAVSLSLGYGRADFGLRRFKSGAAAPVAVDQRFSLEEWQAGATVSKRWKFFEPYGGLRLFRHSSSLRDLGTAERVAGRREGFSPFAGARFEYLPRESVVVELAGADEQVVAVGLSIGF